MVPQHFRPKLRLPCVAAIGLPLAADVTDLIGGR
jgi:hypothetical protein